MYILESTGFIVFVVTRSTFIIEKKESFFKDIDVAYAPRCQVSTSAFYPVVFPLILSENGVGA